MLVHTCLLSSQHTLLLFTQKDKAAVSVSQSLVCDDAEASVKIPPFYFPLGRPLLGSGEVDISLKLAREYLQKSPKAQLKQEDMHGFCKVELCISPVGYVGYLYV